IELSNIKGLATPKAKLIGLRTEDFWRKSGMLQNIEHSLEKMSTSDIKCARQNQNIPAISQDESLRKENEMMLKKKRKGELEAFKAFGLPLSELKQLYIKYLKTKAASFDVKLI
ncbi:MAG: hypothetical protein ACFFDM_04155, partial [Candidatus Thorarchaeota archaeon]